MACKPGLPEGDENEPDGPDQGDWAGDILCSKTERLPAKALASKRKFGEKDEVRSEPGQGFLEKTGKALSALILKWFPHSPDELVQLNEFEETFPNLYWNETFCQKMVSISFDHAKKKFTKQSTKAILEQRYNQPIPFYLAPMTYYNPKFSAQILARLILEQNGGDITNAISFVTVMFEVADKLYPKKNTLLITSPPSCGKTYLINSFVKNFWSVGYIQNNKKHGSSDFNYQDAVGMRINLWNECLMEGKTFVEQAKQVWEGDDVSVNVKHQRMKIMKRTPLFITANQDPWTFCMYAKQAFIDRCFHYKWRKQPWLAKLDAYPVPICWHLIMQNYKDVEWWNVIPPFEALIADGHKDESFFDHWLKSESTPEEWLYINTQL